MNNLEKTNQTNQTNQANSKDNNTSDNNRPITTSLSISPRLKSLQYTLPYPLSVLPNESTIFNTCLQTASLSTIRLISKTFCLFISDFFKHYPLLSLRLNTLIPFSRLQFQLPT